MPGSEIALCNKIDYTLVVLPGRVVQSVTCLATDDSLTADSGVASLIRPGTIL